MLCIGCTALSRECKFNVAIRDIVQGYYVATVFQITERERELKEREGQEREERRGKERHINNMKKQNGFGPGRSKNEQER